MTLVHMNSKRRGLKRKSLRQFQPRKEGESHVGAAPTGAFPGNITPPAGGNVGESGAPGQGQNNTGENFDAASFWGSQDNNGEGGDSNSGSGGSGPADLGNQLTTQLAAMSFGDPIFTQEVAEQINNGDFTGVQGRFDAMGQNIVRQSMGMAIQVMRAYGEQLQTQMRGEFDGTLSGRDNNAALLKDFPSAKDPRVAPVVKQVFEQALKNTNGKRELAVKQTREMLALMTNVTSGDLGLNLVPEGGDPGPALGKTNWLDELTIR